MVAFTEKCPVFRLLNVRCNPVTDWNLQPITAVADWGKQRRMAKSRVSIILGPMCLTLRTPVVNSQIPAAVMQALEEAKCVVVAPMMAADKELASHVLCVANQSVLMLSADQLSQPHDCFELMSQASVTVLADSELEQLIGFPDEEKLKHELQLYGVPALIVTSAQGATAYVRGRTIAVPAFATSVKRTVGAGDVFVGTLDPDPHGTNWRNSISRSLAACSVHLEDAPMTAAAVTNLQASRPRALVEPKLQRPSAVRKVLAAASIIVVAVVLAIVAAA